MRELLPCTTVCVMIIHTKFGLVWKTEVVCGETGVCTVQVVQMGLSLRDLQTETMLKAVERGPRR